MLSDRARLITLCAFLVLVFLTGGSSRPDMASLIVLHPMSLLVMGYGLVTLSAANARNYLPLVLIAASVIALALLQLVPLPPSLWHSLPGRQEVVEMDGLLGMDTLWRPLTQTPQMTRNALMALVAPSAVLVLAIQLDRRGLEVLLTVMLAIGVLSAAWAMFQLLGNPRGPLYLYRITNYGAPVGLFANRNHQAVFLVSLLPLAYTWTKLRHGSWKDLRSDKGRRVGLAAAAALLLVPLILISGSRAGLLTLGLSICLTAVMVVAAPRRARRHSKRLPPAVARFAPAISAVVALAGLAFVTVGVGRGTAFERLVGSDPIEDKRSEFLPDVWKITMENFPWGSGFGSFDSVYRHHESDALLMPSYLNHAHNDFLEVVMTGGLAGLAILTFAAAYLVWRACSLFRPGRSAFDVNAWPIASLISLAILFVASMVDYPLRTPALASYAVLLAVWSAKPNSASVMEANGRKRTNANSSNSL